MTIDFRNRAPAALLATLLALAPPLSAAPSDEEVRFVVEAFDVTGPNPLPAAETRRILAPYRGQQAGFLGLRNAADALQQAMRGAGHQFHRVFIPPQRARETIELRTVVFRLEDVVVQGAEHFDDDNVRAMLPSLASGRTPDPRLLKREVRRANAHPAKRLGLTMRRSEREGYVDAVVDVSDQSPHRVFLSAHNEGSREAGEERLALGYQYANLFDLDHVVTATYTTAPGKWSRVAQYGLTYRMPFYEGGSSLTLLGSYSDVESGTVARFFDVTGQGQVVGAILDHDLLGDGAYSHGIQLSVHDKLFVNDVDFLGQPVGEDVRARPIALRYDGEWVRPTGNLGFHIEFAGNLESGDDNNVTQYAASRAGASPDWQRWRAGAFADWRLGGAWLLRARIDGQYAGDPLIAGEQFGLGGFGSIRGFLPRTASADDAVSGSVELWFPKPRKSLSVLGFVDGGVGWRHNAQAREDSEPAMTSVGSGLRWRPRDWLTANVDWAYVIDGVPPTEGSNHRVHFNFTAVF